MIPKKIHLCWFSGDDYPVEIKRCIDSWVRILPDYEIRLWNARDARSIHCQFIDEALDARKWAFAADAVRFYAVWKEGGVYMDSDILLYNRFDSYIPDRGFVAVHEHIGEKIQLQAAFFMGEKGNGFCREMYEYYSMRRFKLRDGSYDQTISPVIMKRIASQKGYQEEDVRQSFGDNIVVLPGYLVTPNNHDSYRHPEAFARHTIYGSWRHRKIGRRIELAAKHFFNVVSYGVSHMFNPVQLPPSK